MIQTVGKYAGLEFEDILLRDLPYCEFMLTLKFVKPENVALVKYLTEHIVARREKYLAEKIAQMRV